MRERAVRELLHAVCADLDLAARRVARVVAVPTVLGAGLALGTGCSGRPVQLDAVSGPVPIYSAPAPPPGDAAPGADSRLSDRAPRTPDALALRPWPDAGPTPADGSTSADGHHDD